MLDAYCISLQGGTRESNLGSKHFILCSETTVRSFMMDHLLKTDLSLGDIRALAFYSLQISFASTIGIFQLLM